MKTVYTAAVILHVLAVLGGLVAVGVSGGYFAAGWRQPANPAVRQFFVPRSLYGPRLLYPAAALGLVAAATSRGRIHLGSAWVVLAAGLWVLAMAAVELVMRPAERAVGAAMEAGTDAAAPSRRGLAGAVGAAVCLVVASVVMTGRPG